MQQKITWMLFLAIGISSCEKSTITDYKTNLNFVFENNTKYAISFNEGANVLNVAPRSKSSFTVSTEGPKELSKDDFRTSPVQSLCSECIVFYDNIKCDTLNGSGIESIENYDFIRLQQGDYELKYTFEETDYVKAGDCP